ncbi:MAG: hypothetical protein IJX44_07560 [Bacteroidaceae bacterium]|nr:hypothetical protein [Bacteroidaceae bacterium]
MLIHDYYTIESNSIEGGIGDFCIRLNAGCRVYQGHFPGKPVSPGVCNIQMLKELAELMAGQRLFMNNLQQCRLTTLITPDEHPTLKANLLLEKIDGGYKLRAALGQDEAVFLEMKAELTPAK